jgi:membrane protease YdiL (CAAX protease family)
MKVDTNTIKKSGISVLAIYVCLIITILLSNVIPDNMMNDLFNYSLPVLIGLVGFPLIILKMNIVKITDKPNFNIGIQELILLLVSIFIAVIKSYIGLNYIISVVVIAFSEEFLFRYFLIDDKTYFNLMISSLVFAFVVHMNEPLMTNLVIRLPLGVVLGLVYIK